MFPLQLYAEQVPPPPDEEDLPVIAWPADGWVPGPYYTDSADPVLRRVRFAGVRLCDRILDAEGRLLLSPSGCLAEQLGGRHTVNRGYLRAGIYILKRVDPVAALAKLWETAGLPGGRSQRPMPMGGM